MSAMERLAAAFPTTPMPTPAELIGRLCGKEFSFALLRNYLGRPWREIAQTALGSDWHFGNAHAIHGMAGRGFA